MRIILSILGLLSLTLSLFAQEPPISLRIPLRVMVDGQQIPLFLGPGTQDELGILTSVGIGGEVLFPWGRFLNGGFGGYFTRQQLPVEALGLPTGLSEAFVQQYQLTIFNEIPVYGLVQLRLPLGPLGLSLTGRAGASLLPDLSQVGTYWDLGVGLDLRFSGWGLFAEAGYQQTEAALSGPAPLDRLKIFRPYLGLGIQFLVG